MRPWKLLTFAVLALSVGACATTPAPQATEDKGEMKRVEITGSRIPRKVEPGDLKSVSIYPLYVVTEEEIERSGEPLIGEYLRQLPFFR